MVFLRVGFVHKVEHPCDGFFEHRRLERVADKLPLAAARHQVGSLQEVEVVRDAGLADGKVLSDLARSYRAITQQLQDGAPRPVVQCLKYRVHLDV